MKRNRPAFKDTQLFDWDSEPSLERSSSFFVPHELEAPAKRRSIPDKRGGVGAILLICALLIGTGFIVLIEMPRHLQALFGG